jgi:HTH-type transcriptional regulator/antitoxin HipB
VDTRYGDECWWHDGEPRYVRDRPWYTFDRDRGRRDAYRRRGGTPTDHQLPQPGDSPRDRATTRRREQLRRRAEERERAFLAGEFAHRPDPFECSCLPACDELDAATGELVHGVECPCLCDLS